MRSNYYNVQKCRVGDEVFDSRKEMRRYQELCLLEKAGQISNLRRQVKYVLIPSQREVIMKNGKPKMGKVVERGCSYIADFVYTENGKEVVEDVKGKNYRTEKYLLKRKMMLYFHGIRIREV